MRRAVLWAAALAVALIPSRAGAQSLMLTESDALARLSTNGPRVRAARAGIDIARVDVLSAGRWPNPRVNWDRQAVAGVTEHYVTVSQVLPITGRRAFDVQAASALVSASSSRADDEVRRLRADLRRAFAELVAAQTRERELSAARDRLRELSERLGEAGKRRRRRWVRSASGRAGGVRYRKRPGGCRHGTGPRAGDTRKLLRRMKLTLRRFWRSAPKPVCPWCLHSPHCSSRPSRRVDN